MSMNPISTTKTIKDDYCSYLESLMQVRSNEINLIAKEAIGNSEFVKGPYLELTPPFETGGSLNSLIDSGYASADFTGMLNYDVLNRPLYQHQEQAFLKIAEQHRNLIVSTGTGSGKTECYLYPIFDHLMKEKEKGLLGPGVRALLLFPMNALANDQVKRLRELLEQYPDITFGRYTGETLKEKDLAYQQYVEKYNKEPLPNELLSRKEMQATPPNILLTNYAMLEYLLLRPADSTLFDGWHGRTWKFIVLDEAHTYKGSSGTEIAYLLRRLKDRTCSNERGKITCIATSATLGDVSKLGELAEFATNIFDEHFDTDDIILSKRIYNDTMDGLENLEPHYYEGLLSRVMEIEEESDKEIFCYENLKHDRRIRLIQSILREGPQKLRNVAAEAFPELFSPIEQELALKALIELGAMARPNQYTAALLPARYHLFVKALEGMFVQLYPRVQVYLDRQKSNIVNGRPIQVFEFANCQHCHQEYIIGCEDEEEKLIHQTENEKANFYMLTDQSLRAGEIDVDEDETAFEEAVSGRTEEMILCSVCGKITPANLKARGECCEVNDPGKLIKVYKVVSKTETNTCAMCGDVSKGILKRFMTSNQAATFVLADSIYKKIPPNKVHLESETIEVENLFGDEETGLSKIEISNDYLEESGRKLLVFSDNRQEAAYFAGYMDRKYSQNMWRKLILSELRKRNGEAVSIDDLTNSIVSKAEAAGLYSEEDIEDSPEEKKILARKYLFSEFLIMEKLMGLEGRTYLDFYPEPPKQKKGAWRLDAEHTWNLFRFMMDTLRIHSAVSYPEHIDPRDEFFEPRNRAVYFRKEKGENFKLGRILGFIPSSGNPNRRSRIINKLLAKQDMTDQERKDKSNEILLTIWDQLMGLAKQGYLNSEPITGQGICYTLNYKKWRVRLIGDEETVYRCDRCGKTSTYTIDGFCLEAKCPGKHVSVKASDCRTDKYYSNLYNDEKIIPMQIREHTAQLKKDTAGEYQEQFEKGLLNILSCSTTFEMGVDVGQLEAILLRNVPPGTANYVQRAGRAGRRTSSAAFSVTYARRNSHDLNYYREPSEMISGKIKAPYIETENEKIAERHANSIVCSWFFKNHSKYFDEGAGTIAGMNGNEDMAIVLRRELQAKPVELIASMKHVFSDKMLERIGITDWSYINQLVDPEGKTDLVGSLSKAVAARKETLLALDLMWQDCFKEKKKGSIITQIEKMQKTYQGEDAIPFLASNGVLPKYGFPIDVVNLEIYNSSEIAKGIDISRDLKMAIAEYAPGSSIVAGKKVWKSHSLNTIQDKGWPTFRYFECGSCKAIAPPDPGDELAILTEKPEEGLVKSCKCGKTMREKKFIIPQFGFSTCLKDIPKRVTDVKPKKDYATKTQFWGVDRLDAYQEKERKESTIVLGQFKINATYSPNGKLVVLNRGSSGMGFFVCLACGYAQTHPGKGERHLNKHGNVCGNTMLYQTSLGHKFNSDILKLEIPLIHFEEEEKWPGDKESSVLYAILEGASDILGIDRNDINGCIDYTGNGTVLILFDEATGGAGHVKRIFSRLEDVLSAALRHVDGTCGCGPETSCYGCLRNYGNQLEHDSLVRGLAKEYLKSLLEVKAHSRVHSHIEDTWPGTEQKGSDLSDQSQISDGWKAVLELFDSPMSRNSYDYALKLIQFGTIDSPDEVGHELTSEEYGVLGYEAEMVWNKKKVALILPEHADDTLNAYKELGWNAIEMTESNLDHLKKLLQ